MRLCRNHSAELRAALEHRGLRHLIGRPLEEYDAMRDAWSEICGQFTRDYGAEVAFTSDACPLCSLEADEAGRAATWIDGSANDALVMARDLGLLIHATIN